MASSPLRAPAAAAGQQQSRLMDMQKKFQQRHLAAVAAMNNATKSMTLSNNTTDLPASPVKRLGGVGIGQQHQQQRQISNGVGSVTSGNGSDSVVQVDVKGKVRQLFAERNQQQVQGLGYQHHQQQQRQRRRSLTGRDRSRPLRPLSGTNNDPLCKTVCFTAPSLAGGADLVGINGTGSDLRGELLALFGRLPNLGGQLLSESFRGANKMKTAQSAPELKWLLDGGTGKASGPGPPVMAGPRNDIGGQNPPVIESKKGKVVIPKGVDDDSYDGDDINDDPKRQSGGKINTKTATIPKKPTTTAVANGYGAGRGLKNTVAGGTKPAGNKPAGATNHTNRLLLPPVVQPTVINALAAGAGAAAAVASVSAATAAGAQKPLVRAAKLPPTNHGSLQKPTAAPRRAAAAQPSKVTAPASRRPIPKRSVPAPTTARSRPQSVKPQLSMDRGPPAPGMARCSLCARDFKTERLPKHEEVCRKRNRKRKVFDASRQRLEAVAAETGMDVNSLKKMSQKTDQQVAEKLRKKKDAWRRQHDQLVRNVRAARAVQRHLAAGGSIRDLPPELENEATNQDDEVDSDLVKCPHCGRTFNDAAAERHVPLCAERQRNAAARAQNKRR